MFLHIGCVFVRNKSTSAFCLKGKELATRVCGVCLDCSQGVSVGMGIKGVCVDHHKDMTYTHFRSHVFARG